MTVALTESFHSLETAFPASEIGKVNDSDEYDQLDSCIPIVLQITINNKAEMEN